ncbi:hypothetical protein [Sphingobacterium thalpophilum]|uniref:hypothetical protein n=1 Tax=Sphingobacterium thalpophilum TaxID=259 RepID=UPI003D99DBE9
MPQTLISPLQIEQATLRLVCGEEHGTAFFISKTHILTARHVVIDAIEEGATIYAYPAVLGRSLTGIPCTLLANGGDDLDVALLEIPEQKATFSLPLLNSKVRYNALWETFGYPFEHKISGNRYFGSVRKTNIDKPYDIELIDDLADNKIDYRGLSGAALVIENEVAGIMTFNILDGFGAVSIAKIALFLEEQNIPFRETTDMEDLPESLKGDLNETVPNGATIALLDKKITVGGKYYLLHGSPGSGKTLISAALSFSDSNRVVTGRYFVRLPNDQRPTSYRVSREAFLEWTEDLISQRLTGSVYPRQTVSWDKRVYNFQLLLNSLNDYHKQRNEIGVFVLDGLDDIHGYGSNGLSDFFALFPETLPSHLSILLAIIRKDSLPPFIQAEIGSNQEIKVTPLEIDQCAFYLHEQLKGTEPVISFHLLQQIAEKSEGHPLYLRYLTEQLKTNRAEDLTQWIQELPTIDGDIAKYYERIWLSDFSQDQEKLWIALMVSQLRQPVGNKILLKMLPENSRIAFVSKFPSIRHLFKVNGKTGIYHSSFALFIERKTEDLVQIAHDYIATFCNQFISEVYSITNIVYHTLHSTNPHPAIQRCDQQWADACAMISVEPDLVISDIAKVESYCLDLGDFSGLVRIKLLMQRIRFRYDNVLAANAGRIARLLLAMGNPGDALKYIVRFSALIISDEEALWFLRKFNEIGASKEAEQLMRAIRSRYQALFEHFREKGRLPMRIFSLMAKSKALDAVNDREYAITQVTGILKNLMGIAQDTENAGENAEGIQILREDIASFLAAFMTFHTKVYNKRAAEFREMMPQFPKEGWAGQIAKIAIAYDQFREKDKIEEQVAINSQIVEDLEYAVDSMGYLEKDAQFIYAALLEDSKQPNIIKKLILEIFTTPPLEVLRESNGVDANIPFLHKLINYQESLGYLDETNAYPSQRALNRSTFEEVLIDRAKLIGFCFGKAWRLKAEGKMEKIGEVVHHMSNVNKSFRFSLLERSKWDRSYAIPEQIFPHLYDKLIRFYMEFAPDQLEALIGSICSRKREQLGLYTEGFREVLSQIVLRLSRSVSNPALAFIVLKELETHVSLATQNRWERTPLLLEIAEGYAKLGNNEKATSVYQQMLDSSMGPTWYKEDQFSLINTALTLPGVGGNNEIFQHFSKQLEYAAGELTFQRFVRTSQQEFIGNLAYQGNLASAISYYIYQTIPSPVQIIANAERSTVDSIKPGDSYVLGARNINEASGIIHMLKHTEADPLLIWAVAEIFFFNNDIYRYLNSFTELQASCIAKFPSTYATPELAFFRERLKACVLNEEIEGNRHHYLTYLRNELPQSEYELLKTELRSFGIQFPSPPEPTPKRSHEEDEIFDSMGFPGMGKHKNYRELPKILNLAKEQLEIENKTTATEILCDGLLLLHSGKSDIWMGSSLGSEVGEIWDQLAELSNTQQIIKLLKEPIAGHHTQDWRVVEKLLRSLGSKLDTKQVDEILLSVKDHIHYMIREPADIESFNWRLTAVDVHISNDTLLIDLLISLLDHPYISFKKRVLELLLAICKLRTEIIIAIQRRSLSADHSIVREISAYILFKISQDDPTILLKTLEFTPEIKKRMLEEEHFMVRYYFLKMTENIKEEGDNIHDIYQALIDSIPMTISPSTDVELDEPFLPLIQDIIDSLEYLGVLNGSFCRKFMEKVTEVSAPLNIQDQFRAGHYLERSYYDEELHYRRAKHVLRQSINLAVSSRVARENIDKVADILKNKFLDEIRS